MSYEQAYQDRRKRKYKLGTFFLVIFVTIFVFSIDLDQNSGEMCGSCHSMQPQYLTWQVSSHMNTGCVECHADTGIGGNVQMIKDFGRYAYREITDTYFKPVRLFTKVEDERCLRCHNTDRQVSSMGDIFIPHQAHYDSKIRCESCHKSVAHGGIARRGETRLGGLGWNEERAARVMVWENTATTMDECMQCHFRRRVTTECKACHTGLNLPGYHQIYDFGTNHGIVAREILTDCNVCHGYAGTKKMTVSDQTSVRIYSRENTFCKDCHSRLPASHENNWNGRHRNVIAMFGDEGCMTCHDVRESTDFSITSIYCGSCHPSPHRENFKIKHYPDLTTISGPDSTCYMCHSQRRCIGCHGQN